MAWSVVSQTNLTGHLISQYYHYYHRDHHLNHDITMTELTIADLKENSVFYESLRDVGEVLIGEDTAQPLIAASSSGNDTLLRSLLSQPQWIEAMLEKPHYIYSGPSRSENVRRVSAMPVLNVQRCLMVAAKNGHARCCCVHVACLRNTP